MALLAACGSDQGGGADASGEAPQTSAAADPCEGDAFGCVEIGPGEPIVIGTALSVSGADAELGLDSQRGVEVSVLLRNAEFLGRPLELDLQDDGCSAEGGTAAANALVSNPEVVAVVGTSCSSGGVPASEILSQSGILLVSPSNTAPSLTDPATRQPFYARVAHNDKIQGAAMADFACNELNVRRAGTIHDGSPYGEQLQQVFVDEFAALCDGETVIQEAVTVGQVDLAALMTSIAAEEPELLYYPVFTTEGALITQQASGHPGLEGVILAGADGIQSPSFVQAAGGTAEGMYTSGPKFDVTNDRYTSEFLPAYRELQGSDPVAPFHAHAFDATEMILAAIEAVAIEDGETLRIPRTQLRDAFFALANHEGLTGSLSCDPNGDCANTSIGVVQVQDGDFVPVWP